MTKEQAESIAELIAAIINYYKYQSKDNKETMAEALERLRIDD